MAERSAAGGDRGGDGCQGLYARLQQRRPIPLDAELHCAPGEVLALVGPSGSGKSTLLRCIAGLHSPQHGELRCAGELWYRRDAAARTVELAPQRRRVGFVFQHFALMPHLCALDNVGLALGHLPRAARAARAGELLARVHLDGLEQRRPAQLSGGQQQRVALARALARDDPRGPAVLLLDEPFSAVDQVTRRKLRREMVGLTRELRIPILLVTHDLDEARMLGDQLCVLHNGETLQQGRPEEVLERPVSASVARLIDLRNLFEARLVEHDAAAGLSRIDWCERQLEAPLDRRFRPGDPLCFCIAPERILLHQRVRPSRGAAENPLVAQIRDMISVGGLVSVLLDGSCGERLEMDLPPHVAQRNGLRIGDEIGVSLLSESIHLMPWQALR